MVRHLEEHCDGTQPIDVSAVSHVRGVHWSSRRLSDPFRSPSRAVVRLIPFVKPANAMLDRRGGLEAYPSIELPGVRIRGLHVARLHRQEILLRFHAHRGL